MELPFEISRIWIILGIVANMPVCYGLGRLIFKDGDEFGKAIFFWLTPDIYSFIRGEWTDDLWAELKLGFWVFTCIGTVMMEVFLIALILK